MQNRFHKRVLLTAAASAGLGICASQANAALTILLSEPGFASVPFVDSGNTGTVSNFTSYGTFKIIDLEVAVSDKLQSPTPTQATLQITAIIESNTSGGTLTITTSDNQYGFPGVTGNTEFMDSSMSGTLAPATLNDLITFQSTATPTDGVAGTVSSTLQSYTSPGLNSGTTAFQAPDANTNFVRGASFDLSNQLQITMNSAFEQANVGGTTTVSLVQTRTPEPASGMVMLGAIGSMMLGRRRRA